MRADRLVALLLLLQQRQRVTAGMVATELEISERTARRDLEALCVAGLPGLFRAGPGWGLAVTRWRADRPVRADRAGGACSVPGGGAGIGGDTRAQGRSAQIGPGFA